MPVDWGAKPPGVFPAAFGEALRAGGGPLPRLYRGAGVIPDGEVRKMWRGYLTALGASATHPLAPVARLGWRLESRQGVFWVCPAGVGAGTDAEARAGLIRAALAKERRRP